MILAYLLLGIAVLGLVLLVARWFAQAEPRTLVLLVKWVGGTVVALLILYLIVSGRAAWALGVAAGALPFVRRFLLARALFRGLRGGGWHRTGASAGPQRTGVETATLAMTLDHATGEIDGAILKGRFAGRRLSALSLDELLALYADCAGDDPDSVPLIESFLDRSPFRDEWRARMKESAGRRSAASGESMTVEEAREILGVSADATPEEIRRAHRTLMQKNHPDHGGSTYLAAKINQAKEVLLGS